MKYYDGDRLLKLDCDYNFVWSGRGPGKTDYFTRYLARLWAEGDEARGIEPGAQFVRVVRFDFDITASTMSGWVPEHAQNEIMERWHFAIAYRARKYYAVYPSMELPDGTCQEEHAELIGYVLPINKQDDYKSNDFSSVKTVMFEEFCAMRSRDYIRGEWTLFTSLLSTVVRRRKDCKVFFIGNTLTKSNPYFDVLGIDIDRLSIMPGQCRKFKVQGFKGHGATVGLHYAEMAESDIVELSPLMRVPGNEGAVSGTYQDSDEEQLYNSPDVQALLTVCERRPWLPDTCFYTGRQQGQGLYTCEITQDKVYMCDYLLILEKLEEPIRLQDIPHRIIDLSDGDTCAVVQDTLTGDVTDIPLTSKRIYWGDERVMLQLRREAYSCVIVAQDSDIRNRFFNFLDRYTPELLLKG